MDESTWRRRATDKLQQIKQWLKSGDAPYLVYGTVAGLSLWPLVEAAAGASAEQLPISLYLALGNVAGSVGSNLIAEQLQRWQRGAEPVTEEEVIEWMRKAATQDTLRQAVDTILEKFDAVETARASLPEADRTWFTETLRREVERLGNAERYHAVLKGSGAVAQGPGSTAVGERGVYVGGNVGGSVITGSHNTIIQPGGAGASSPVALPRELAGLREKLVTYFNKGELEALCFDLGIPYDDLRSETRTMLAQSLLEHCHHRGIVDDLLRLCREQRPRVNWRVDS